MSGMDVGYTYCLNLTEEEKQKIDEDAQKSRFDLILGILIFVSTLLGARVQAAPIPGAEGFPIDNRPARARPNQRQCRTFGIFSRVVTGTNTQLEAQPDSTDQNTYYDASLNCKFENKQLQKKFKHASYFGISGNYNPAKAALFRRKLIQHMNSTHACLGTYRGNNVYHYYDPNTKLNVMVDRNTNKFISGWKLSRQQQTNMQLNGNIQ